MQSETRQHLLELKYCERCGTLGLRRLDSRHIYCDGCEQEMAKVYLAPRGRWPDGPGKKPCGSVVLDGDLQAMAGCAAGRWS
jgi:hypothetical protein